jgi:hypothetical protein
LINAWSHPFLGSESRGVDVFVDLKKTEGDPGSVDITFGRALGLGGDFWLSMEQVPEFGVMSNQVLLMRPIVILEKMIKLFGGLMTMEKTETARSMTISFPCFKE